jgi:DNA modification methylase
MDTPKRQNKGKTIESLEESQKVRAEFLADFGCVPESILVHDMSDRAIDLQVEDGGRDYVQSTNRTAKELKNVSMRKAFEISGRTCRGKGGGLSRFPQNVGRLILKLYTQRGDTVFDPFCVSGDTLISLPEGDFPIKDLVGKECYVYCSDGKELKLRKAHGIRKTREHAMVIRVWLSNKKESLYIDLTPNHLCMTTSGEWIEAQNLQKGQSLMPFYRRFAQGRWVVQTSVGHEERQSKFVYEEISGQKVDAFHDVHHKDQNKTNDTFLNLSYETKKDHGRIHHPQGGLTHDAIAKLVGVHKNTVGNIARNKFQYNHKVLKIEKLNDPVDVYNMEVEEFNNFVANGIIVHNCGHNSRMQLCYQVGRNYIGNDLSHNFMEDNRKIKEILLAENANGFNLTENNCTITLHEGTSARVRVQSGSCDFTITSPPYWDLEYYGDEPEQLGKNKTYEGFLDAMSKIVEENFRILKSGAYCCWCINDFVKNGIYYPYHADLIPIFVKAGFVMHTIYITDLSGCIGPFIMSILQTKRFPKRHEYSIVFKKP